MKKSSFLIISALFFTCLSTEGAFFGTDASSEKGSPQNVSVEELRRSDECPSAAQVKKLTLEKSKKNGEIAFVVGITVAVGFVFFGSPITALPALAILGTSGASSYVTDKWRLNSMERAVTSYGERAKAQLKGAFPLVLAACLGLGMNSIGNEGTKLRKKCNDSRVSPSNTSVDLDE